MSANNTLTQAPTYWEQKGLKALALWPLSKLFGTISSIRRSLYDLGIIKSSALPVPVVIVGNIRVGGTGKTPTVLALAKTLHAQGFRPGIISRGYKGSNQEPTEVTTSSSPSICGDEPCYMASQLQDLKIPIFIHPNRVNAGQQLLKQYPDVNVIISDDGLQHYSLKRWPAREGGHDLELVIRDARGEGNQFLLPAGPLRESAERPRDFTFNLGLKESAGPYFQDAPSFDLDIKIGNIYQLKQPSYQMPLTSVNNLLDANAPNKQQLLAAAGLGNPKKFFQLLKDARLEFGELPLPDHYDFSINPFKDRSEKVILITEKDAVKCIQLNDYKDDERIWVLPVTVDLPNDFVSQLVDILKRP
jgi:tetraacyldisaccharide 4'-kinase